MRKILFELGGTKAVAEMLDDVVPKTCDAVWKILPVEGMSIHANWASREIMLHLAGDKILRLPAEGRQRRGTTAPGDIVYFWRSPQMSRGKQLAYSAQFQRELSEFAIFYGDPAGGGLAAEDPPRTGRDSNLQVSTLFARFIDAPPEFTRKCEEIRHKGLQKLVVTRLEG
jgi:uncharacterized protein DUF3830